MENYNSKNIPLAKKLRREMTPWERKLWYEFLRTYPVPFRRQVPLLSYILDFYCHSLKLCIELDGGGHTEQEQLEKDAVRTLRLNEIGVRVLRFSNLDIHENFYGVCTFIDTTVQNMLYSKKE